MISVMSKCESDTTSGVSSENVASSLEDGEKIKVSEVDMKCSNENEEIVVPEGQVCDAFVRCADADDKDLPSEVRVSDSDMNCLDENDEVLDLDARISASIVTCTDTNPTSLSLKPRDSVSTVLDVDTNDQILASDAGVSDVNTRFVYGDDKILASEARVSDADMWYEDVKEKNLDSEASVSDADMWYGDVKGKSLDSETRISDTDMWYGDVNEKNLDSPARVSSEACPVDMGSLKNEVLDGELHCESQGSEHTEGRMETTVGKINSVDMSVDLCFKEFSLDSARSTFDNSELESEEQNVSVASETRALSMDAKNEAEIITENSLFFEKPWILEAEKEESNLNHDFEHGDMVWGKVKSHPWWPGHIYNEAFASSSVRRTRREGHILVAFFGDSSYGWFDPAELIPFDPHFAEKSRQTTSRNFVKAVEEAVDEARRRSALGLICHCHNPSSFRPLDVPGYLFVDVDDYEPGAIYSKIQIMKSRESFQPTGTLSFVRKLALAPRSIENTSIEWIKSMSTMLAYRKAVYEEFDETYAQAFGVEPIRPSQDTRRALATHDKVPSRAPLSGPLVIAEVLGGKKPSLKPTKVRDGSKKDKYLFKRREEPFDQRYITKSYLHPVNQFHSDGYVFQKRYTSAVVEKHSASQQTFEPREVMSHNVLSQGGEPTNRKMNNITSSTCQSESITRDSAVIEASKVPMLLRTTEDQGQVVRVMESAMLKTVPQTEDVVPQFVDNWMVKKSDMVHGWSFEKSTSIEKKKKKGKRDISTGTLGLHSHKRPKAAIGGEIMREIDDKSTVGGVESTQGPLDRLNSDAVGYSLDLPQLLEDLLALALDPYHGADRNSPFIVRQAFLRFRALVYQKSLVVPSSSDSDQQEPSVHKATFNKSPFESTPTTEATVVKPPRPIVSRSDDPTKGGKKRSVSERQDEIALKKQKKLKKLKSMTLGKKTGVHNVPESPRIEHKMPESQKESAKETTVMAPKSVKPDIMKKNETPTRISVPTCLLMKFPPRTTLPSPVQLKARFARFGPLDLSGTRVYWKTSTCRVVFKHKSDAQVAYDYARRNNTLFGQIRVSYHLRDLDVPAPELSDPMKRSNDDISDGTPPFKTSGSSNISGGTRTMTVPPRPSVQLKSILKKPSSGDDSAGTTTGVLKETPRVKFVLGGNDGPSKIEPGPPPALTISNNKNATTSSNADDRSLAMDNSKFSFPPLNSPPFRPPQDMSGIGQLHRPPSIHNKDISHQMLNLLIWCNDIVSNVKSTLGYVPYHPL